MHTYLCILDPDGIWLPPNMILPALIGCQRLYRVLRSRAIEIVSLSDLFVRYCPAGGINREGLCYVPCFCFYLHLLPVLRRLANLYMSKPMISGHYMRRLCPVHV